MANICSVTIDITCSNEQVAAILYRKILQDIQEADAKDIGVFIGSDRYLFDAVVSHENGTCYLELCGWVKWCILDNEVIEFIRFICETANITNLRISYEETGCLLYGEYEYDGSNGDVIDTYVPEDKFPDGDCDNYYELLDDALAEHGVTNYVGVILPEEETIEQNLI